MKVYMKTIDMIAWFDCKGHPTPIKFRISDPKEGEKITLSIRNPQFLKEEKQAGNRMLIYRGLVEINNIEKTVELKYEINTCLWYLFKM